MKKGILKAMLVGTMAVTLSVAGILTACGEEWETPVITVDPLTVTVDKGAQHVDLLDGVTVTDVYDKDLKATVSNDGGFTTATVGEYTVTYSATNSHDKTGTATRKYTVQEAGEYSAPVITVDPTEMEFEEGADDVSLTFGVTVTDEYDTSLFATVKSIIGEDGVTEAEDVSEMTAGTWTVTYTATNSKGKEGTATRTYTVTKAASNYVIEVQKENDANWATKCGREAKKLVLDPKWYYEVSEDTSVNAAKSGIYRNMSDNEITVDVIGKSGEVAIFTADGYMIEGRDGANGKLVNKDNPVRTASTVSMLPGTSETVQNACAMNMKIPAHGFAIVIFQNLLDRPGTDEAATLSEFDYGGRGWFNKNVVYQYGTAVKVYLQDDSTQTITTAYENHAPVVLTKPDVSEFVDSTATLEQIKEKLIAGVTYVDDNATFDPVDDVRAGLTITVSNESTPALDLNTIGSYVFELSISDGTLSTTFTRTLNVKASNPTVPTIIIDGEWFELGDNVVVNPTSTSGLGSKDAIIYTSYFTGTKFVNNYGAYFIVGTDGKVRESYSPWDNTHVHMTGDPAVRDGTFNDVLSNASPLAAGEYIVLAVNGGPSFRTKLQAPLSQTNNYMLGKDVSLALIDYQPAIVATKTGTSNSLVNNGSIVINEAVSAADAAKQTFLVYTNAFKGNFACNGSGVAIVIDASGNILKVYDGANGNYSDYTTYDNDYNRTNGNAHFGVSDFPNNYAKYAFENLEDGEILIIFPNDGVNAKGSPRDFGMTLRFGFKDWTITFSNFWIPEVEDTSAELTVTKGDSSTVKYTAESFLYNEAAASVDAAKEVSLLVYDNSFDGTIVCDQKTIAIILDSEGNIARIYDGANGNLHEYVDNAEVKTNYQDSERGWTREETAQTAFASLQEGETLVVFVRNDTLGNDSPHKWANANLRSGDGSVHWWEYTVTLEGNFNES